MQFYRTFYISTIVFITLLITSACDWYGISVEPSTNIIEQYKTLYVNIGLNQSFDNPYNPAEIKVDVFISTPAGQVLTLPCFYINNPLGKLS